MSEHMVFGKCVRCGGSLTSDHKCPGEYKMSPAEIGVMRKAVLLGRKPVGPTTNKLAPVGSTEEMPSMKIDCDEHMNRFYIPVHPDWEIQTKGGGSSFRIAERKPDGKRWIVCDEQLHKPLEAMARAINAAMTAAAPTAQPTNSLLIGSENSSSTVQAKLFYCTHSWHDFGTLGGRNVAWCQRCDTLSFTGNEDRYTHAPHAASEIARLNEQLNNDASRVAYWIEKCDGHRAEIARLTGERNEYHRQYAQQAEELRIQRALAIQLTDSWEASRATVKQQAERIKELSEQCHTNHSMELDSLARRLDEVTGDLEAEKMLNKMLRVMTSDDRVELGKKVATDLAQDCANLRQQLATANAQIKEQETQACRYYLQLAETNALIASKDALIEQARYSLRDMSRAFVPDPSPVLTNEQQAAACQCNGTLAAIERHQGGEQG